MKNSDRNSGLKSNRLGLSYIFYKKEEPLEVHFVTYLMCWIDSTKPKSDARGNEGRSRLFSFRAVGTGEGGWGLKVSKCRFICTKNPTKIFCISTLASSKNGSNQIDTFIFYLTYFRSLGQKSKKFFCFLVQVRTRKFTFEIY